MSESNRGRVAWGRNAPGVAIGTIPATPRMRLIRQTNNGLRFTPEFSTSKELRSDRMSSDPTRVFQTSGGPITSELCFPADNSPESDFYELSLCNFWRETAHRDNDGTAGSVISGVAAGGVVTTTAPVGSLPFAVGQLVLFSGFTNTANNGIKVCTTGSGTVPAFAGGGMVVEAAPPDAARMKVVGFRGAAGDIAATATGLSSTALNFTTLGLIVGQSIKIGDLTDANQFGFLVTAPTNPAVRRRDAWARITAISANALALDNLPSGWAVDAGAGKTITLFFGDTIKNGVERFDGFFDKGFMDHTPPTFEKLGGQVIGTAKWMHSVREQSMAEYTFVGMTGSVSDVALDAAPDPAITNQAVAGGVNMGRISENGVCFTGGNALQSLEITVNNNVRAIEGLKCGEDIGPSTMNWGTCDVSVASPAYFGDRVILTKLIEGTPTNMYAIVKKNNQAIIWSLPRLTLTGDSPTLGQLNTDVIININGIASYDPLTQSHIVIDRFEYWA